MRSLLLLAAVGLLPASAAGDYVHDVKPLLRERCIACHGPLKQKARLRLDAGTLLRKGGKHGPAVVPGKAAASLLYQRVTTSDVGSHMPPEGSPLTPAQIAALKSWIDGGAIVPADDRAEEDPRSHWAFRTPVRPPLPAVKDPRWAQNPIDAFVAAEQEKHDLQHVPPADRPALLRRIYLDLVGLPPTRQELHDFLSDDSADAYEKVVDQLLSSPQYGERWARHWMDVWRYSDWYGRRAVPDVMNSYPRIWRWRDWIVRSVNEDKGYDRQIVEMLAADEVAPTDDANIVATGFLVRNWFKWNYNVWMKDTVEHTGKAFLGLTLNCCHCHDHKYDPITQEEYFRFRAFFEPLELRHDRVPGEPDPGPFRKYVYVESYGPITSGMVRVFDEKLDAQTWMYQRGDHRLKMEGKPPVTPGAPAALGGDRLKIEPVDLPREAWYPGLKPFVQQEETAKAQAAITAAERGVADAGKQGKEAVAVAEARLRAARSTATALAARIAADRTRYLGAPGNADDLARAASKADRQAALDEALAKQLAAEQALAAEQRKPPPPGAPTKTLDNLMKQAEVAKKAVATARAALPGENTNYTPLTPMYPRQSTGRRTALAHWIASRDNPLTARVAVNHVWRWHFGRALVDTTADFGRKGARPSHPELLDWLAVELMDNGWHFKAIHRLIVTSNAYRQRSTMTAGHGPDSDADNRYLWHFPVQRMEAEEVRDSVLYLAGELDSAMGGVEIPHEQGLSVRRRSLYFAHHGESKMQMLEIFDAANPCDCYRRVSTIVPQQALALANSELTLHNSRLLARRLSHDLGAAPDADFTIAAFEQVLGRPPTAAEHAAALAFLDRQQHLYHDAAKGAPVDDTLTAAAPASDPALRARESLVHALFNHNDFVTIR
jgi:hypothetical protein